MEISHVYVKTRAEFGKQCIFDNYDNVDQDIQPDPAFMSDYVLRNPCNVAVQRSQSLAVHEAQTQNAEQKNSGMFHSEGGWPKEINSRDEEATARFRRRVEKDEGWAPKLKLLFKPMEHCVLQNNAINIHQHYFDEFLPTALTRPVELRTVKTYADPRRPVRPINGISWSSDSGRKMAVSYCSVKFQDSNRLSPCSFIWEIENPNDPSVELRTSSPLTATEFCPSDPFILASGLISGQVCTWDIRTGGQDPVQMSHRRFSHRCPVCAIKWIHSAKSTESFSASSDGRVMWWDTRQLRRPTEVLLVKADPKGLFKEEASIGVSSVNFEPTMGTRFLLGTESGIVLGGSRKGRTTEEKLPSRFHCHAGPVVTVVRNSHNPKYFLTIGDWTARIWAEDTKENCLTSTRCNRTFLSGACWSNSRCSVFYTIDRAGYLDGWDLLAGTREPIVTAKLCEDRLTAISPHQNGVLMAVGTYTGNVHLIEASEALTGMNKSDKLDFVAYAERCSHHAKALDTRLKEIKLTQKVIREVETPEPALRVKPEEDRGKGKVGSKREDKRKLDEAMLKSKEDRRKLEDPELSLAETEYYRIIGKEMERYRDEELNTDRSERRTTREKKHGGRRTKQSRKGEERGKDEGEVVILGKRTYRKLSETYERELEIKEEAETSEGASKSAKEETDEKISVSLGKIGRKFGPVSSALQRSVLKSCDAIYEETIYREKMKKEDGTKGAKVEEVNAIANKAGSRMRESVRPSLGLQIARVAEGAGPIRAGGPRKRIERETRRAFDVVPEGATVASRASTRPEETSKRIVRGSKRATNAGGFRVTGVKLKPLTITSLDGVAEEGSNLKRNEWEP